jgi:hypothetical protein
MAKSGAANLFYYVAKAKRIRSPLLLRLYYRRNLQRIAPVMSIPARSFFGAVIVDERTASPTKILLQPGCAGDPQLYKGYTTLASNRIRRPEGMGVMDSPAS